MLDACVSLVQEAVSLGWGDADVTALARAFEERPRSRTLSEARGEKS